MAKRESAKLEEEGAKVCINEALTDDELRAVLARLDREEEKDTFGLVCKRWFRLQSSERRRLRARAGPAMLRRMADRFSGLVELDLSQSASRSFYPGVTDSDLSVIAAGFRVLRVLNLQNCKGVTDSGMLILGNGLPTLQSLDISHCRKLTDKGLTAVALGCCNLRRFHLAGCKSITDDLLQALSRTCSHLEELGLAGCNSITDSGLSFLANGCHFIKYLDVSKCSKISDVGVSRVAEVSSSYLKTLKLLDCYKVGDKSIFTLADSCHNLETLVIGGCHDVSDESMKSLALACVNSLKNLRMDWCLNVTDLSLNCLLSNCRYLMALDIGCCDKVTDSAFQALGMGGFESDLKVLKASNCLRITVTGVGTILQYCRSMEYLDLRSCPNVTRLGCEQAGLQFPERCKTNFDGSLSESDAMVDMFF
ncbi:F-box/LRR-repeat protein 3-like [Phoenix dactylifera]|uniref:F-box/LRR-repeat protein 3-like n=1 Tax=Phoenix dactylifera TaxID=42345 RepID=A0A8B8ZKQ1_PHODC|nr:F-box/LRR-repeat protein 3-like [Phoenix dactylifera]